MILNKKLHIVSFDVPYPPDYGGVIDVLYKLKSLSKLGAEIYLHTFEYGKGESIELEKYCKKVYYYYRNNSAKKLFSSIPYIVNTRKNADLIENLNSINIPILFEGLHTTYPIISKRFTNRKILVRAHNIEHNYYKKLSISERKIFKKIYYLFEALKLKYYEKILNKCNYVLTISEADQHYYKKKYGEKAVYVPVFHPNKRIKKVSKKGYFALFHGNLKVSDNLKALDFLISIFKTIDYPLIICGNFENPSIQLKLNKAKNIHFIPLKNQSQLNDLIGRAHINLLPTFQNTGIKLKLINSLFNGRFCLVNNEMVIGTGLEELCAIANGKKDFKKNIVTLIQSDYEEKEIIKKEQFLKQFDNQTNAKIILKLLKT